MSHRVAPGDKAIPASALNDAFEAADRVLGRQGGAAARARGAGHVLIKNNSGADIDRFGVLGIGGVEIDHATNDDEFLGAILLDGEAPTKADHWSKFVVCPKPIADGAIGPAMMSGLVQTQVDILHADNRFADVKDGDDTQLVSSGAGSARIVWQEAGTGTKWALVELSARHSLDCEIEITGNAQENAGRFRYAWSEVALNASAATHATVTGGLSGDDTAPNCAYSLLELGEDGTGYVAGVNLSGTDYPAGFAPRPIAGGGTANTHRQDTVVAARYVDGRMWIVGPALTHDGTCT